MKNSWKAPLAEAIKFTVTILVYNFTKELPPEFGNQLVDSIFAIGTVLASALVTALIFNFLLGLPKIQVAWIIGYEPPASNRPELPTGKTGVSFRYKFESQTMLAKWLMSLTHKYEMEAEIRFSPVENLALSDQNCGPETTVAGSCVTTRFAHGLQPGDGADGQISLRRIQRRKMSTPIDCTLSIRPSAASRGKSRAKLLSKLFLTDASIEGFVMKGGS